jgi:hypothetical protein
MNSNVEGQIETDWEIQVVALLGSQTHFAETNIPNQGPGLLCVMCQLVVTWRHSTPVLENSYHNNFPLPAVTHGNILPPPLQPIAITPVHMQTLFTNIALINERQEKLDDILTCVGVISLFNFQILIVTLQLSHSIFNIMMVLFLF